MSASLFHHHMENDLSSSSPMFDVYDALMPVSQAFPKLLQSVKTALTMGVSSASAERSFSSLRRIKSYLCTTMSKEQLSHLAILHIERDLSSKLWNCLDDIVVEFSNKHKTPR